MQDIILSICIPTINRSEILQQTLESLLSYEVFDGRVQIVVGDNASTDNTEDVVNDFIERYPDKNIKYFKNKTNIGIKNFFKVLENADGLYCKLLNDYSQLSNEDLTKILSKVLKYKDYSHDYYLNFTFNVRGFTPNTDEISIHGVADFITTINNKVTWVSNFGCFKDQIKDFDQFERYDYQMLNLMYWSLHLAKTRRNTIICPLKQANCLPVPLGKRNMTYSFFEPHVIWYYDIISHFVQLSSKQLRKDKTRLLSDFVGNNIINHMIMRRPTAFNMKGGWKIVWKYFHNVPYFYFFIPLKITKRFLIKILEK